MRSPVCDIIITSPWGMRTLSFINGGQPMMHPGVDIRAPFGAQIQSVGACKILRFGRGDYQENFLVAQLLDCDTVVKFIHCKWLDSCVIGKPYAEGEVICVSDGSGTSDGKGGSAPHLHFETWHGGEGRAPKGLNYNPTDFFAHYQIDFAMKAD